MCFSHTADEAKFEDKAESKDINGNFLNCYFIFFFFVSFYVCFYQHKGYLIFCNTHRPLFFNLRNFMHIL